MNIRTLVENEKLNIEKSILEKEKLIGGLPEGTLQLSKSRNAFNWLHRVEVQEPKGGNEESKEKSKNSGNSKKSTGRKFERRYIPKENKALAVNLAYKGYLQAQLKDDYANLKAFNDFLKNFKANYHTEKYIQGSPARCMLVMQRIQDSDKEIEKWMRDKYLGEVPYKHNLRYLSQGGFYVRSKSEQIIVALLLKYQIPFKYEQQLYVNGNNLYPDFLIMHPQTHKIYLWEHLGLMDEYSYRKHSLDKINDYYILGFRPGDNLIMTYETDESGIDEILAEKLVKHYFT